MRDLSDVEASILASIAGSPEEYTGDDISRLLEGRSSDSHDIAHVLVGDEKFLVGKPEKYRSEIVKTADALKDWAEENRQLKAKYATAGAYAG